MTIWVQIPILFTVLLHKIFCSVCGTVGKAATFNTIDLLFESSHQQILSKLYGKEKNKEKRKKRPGMAQFLNNVLYHWSRTFLVFCIAEMIYPMWEWRRRCGSFCVVDAQAVTLSVYASWCQRATTASAMCDAEAVAVFCVMTPMLALTRDRLQTLAAISSLPRTVWLSRVGALW